MFLHFQGSDVCVLFCQPDVEQLLVQASHSGLGASEWMWPVGIFKIPACLLEKALSWTWIWIHVKGTWSLAGGWAPRVSWKMRKGTRNSIVR